MKDTTKRANIYAQTVKIAPMGRQPEMYALLLCLSNIIIQKKRKENQNNLCWHQNLLIKGISWSFSCFSNLRPSIWEKKRKTWKSMFMIQLHPLRVKFNALNSPCLYNMQIWITMAIPIIELKVFNFSFFFLSNPNTTSITN